MSFTPINTTIMQEFSFFPPDMDFDGINVILSNNLYNNRQGAVYFTTTSE